MTRALLEQCLTKWLEDADPDECIDLVEFIRAELAKPQSEPVAWLVKTDSGTMVWPIEDFNDAGAYCEPDEFPQYLYLHPAHTEEDVQSILRNRRVEFSEYEAHVRRILGVSKP